ncbi:MAG: hypothetical protein V4547_16715 [Bacteroidota bacterium]
MKNILLEIHLLNCNNHLTNSTFDIIPYLPILIALIAGLVALYNVKQNIILQYKVKQVELIKESASKYFTLTLNLKVIALNAIYNLKNEPDTSKHKKISDDGYEKYINTATEVANYENLIKLQLQKDNPIHEKVGKYMENVTTELEAIRQAKSTDENKLKTELGNIGNVLVSIFKEKLGKNY